MKSRVKAKARGRRKSTAASKAKVRATATSVKARPAAKSAAASAAKADPLDSWIAAGVSALGLRVEKSWMPAIRANLRVTLDQGLLAAEFPLPDDAEPAPVFRA